MGVELEISDNVARVTIDRPERLNAVDSASATRLAEIWAEIEARDDIRCAILTGSGEKAFCAGDDLKDESSITGEDYWRNLARDFPRLTLRRSLKIPVIARVNGLALGGGFELVLGCDIVIAADHARFSFPECKVGRLPLDGGMVQLPRLIPRNIAMGMMLTGRMIAAQDMHHYGLVNAVVPMADLDQEVEAWVNDILAAAPLSLRAIKATVRDTGHMSPHDAYSQNLPELLAALNSEDGEEGVRAFREKRAPRWKGR